MNEKSITKFLSEEYKDFAMYVVEGRAIPSVIDGLKPSQRKILHGSSMIWKTGNEKALKVFQLSGFIASNCFYHHGDCLDPNTEIVLSNGEYITIKDWYDKFPDKKLEVLSYDEVGKEFVKGTAHSPRIGSLTIEEFEIELEDGNIVKCTSNHPFLTDRGWVQAKDLLESDNIKSFFDTP